MSSISRGYSATVIDTTKPKICGLNDSADKIGHHWTCLKIDTRSLEKGKIFKAKYSK
jgi:hypothetical protein